VVQSMPDVSPTRWHLAHTSWFFDRLVLRRAFPDRRSADERFDYLFNSYYNTLGEQYPRARRGVLSRPTVEEVSVFRRAVDEQMRELLERIDEHAGLAPIIETGLHHEQQHQELMLTDIKHVFSCNPLLPVYRAGCAHERGSAAGERGWVAFDEGLRWIGHEGEAFAYDNERPRHRAFVHAFRLATRPVTSGEYLEFIDNGCYDKPEFWLSDGWATRQDQGWEAPLYWQKCEGAWYRFTLGGLEPIDPAEPVCHISFYEADAYAAWAGARLPTEAEWELASESIEVAGNFVESGRFHPAGSGGHDGLLQMFGDVWEWTGSPYVAYPGYVRADGPLGEYNGKFMCNQMVLRGGSCATPQSHIRRTYRNFFHPHCRWQFSGLRLASDA